MRPSYDAPLSRIYPRSLAPRSLAVIFKNCFIVVLFCVGFNSEVDTWDVRHIGAIDAGKKQSNSLKGSTKD